MYLKQKKKLAFYNIGKKNTTEDPNFPDAMNKNKKKA